MGSCKGVREGNVTNDLSILPGMGKIKLAAGSLEWGTRGKRDLPHYATRFGVEIQGEDPWAAGMPSALPAVNEMNPLAGIYGSCAFSL